MTLRQAWIKSCTSPILQGCTLLFLCLPACVFASPQLKTPDDTSKAESLIAAGVAHEAKGDNTSAENDYRSALSLDTTSITALAHLASLLENENHFAAALHYWKQALSLRPNDPDLRSSTGAAFLQNGQNQAALATLQPLAQTEPVKGAVLINIGTALSRLERFTEALDAYRKASALPDSARTAQLALVKALITLVRYAEALPVIEAYTKSYPDDAEGRTLLGMTYQELSRNAEAEVCLRTALAIDPNDFDTEYHLGAVLRAQAKNMDAIAHLRKAIDLRPQSQEAHFQLARAYRATQQASLAANEETTLKVLESARISDTQLVVLQTQATEAQAQGNLETAIKLNQHMLAIRPGDAKVLYNLALLYEKNKDPTQERILLEQALANNPTLSVAHAQLGFLDIAEGHPSAGEKELRTTLKLDPQNIQAMGNLGVLEAQAGRLDEARHLLQLAVESDPSYVKGLLNLGLVLATEGQYQQAEQALTSALLLKPGDASLLQALDQVHSTANNERNRKP